MNGRDIADTTFEPISGSERKYRLVLDGVSPNVIYFSDRPTRLAGQITQNEFSEGIGFAIQTQRSTSKRLPPTPTWSA